MFKLFDITPPIVKSDVASIIGAFQFLGAKLIIRDNYKTIKSIGVI